jgi:hypothetical protein
METVRIGGIIIIIILLLSLVAAAYSMIMVPQHQQEETITNNYTLSDADMAGVNRVNLNYNGNTTGLGMKFQNKSDNLYNITIDRDKGTKEPNVTYTRNGDVLDVNITLDEGNANINLGNRCTYNTTIYNKIGGFGVLLDNQAKLDNLNVTQQYMGGGMLLLGDATFNRTVLNTNLGGFMIKALPGRMKSGGNITTNVQIGGVTLEIPAADNLGYRVRGTYDIGGMLFTTEEFNVLVNTTNTTEIETKNYQSKSIKLNIENILGVGSVNINMFSFPIEMFN